MKIIRLFVVVRDKILAIRLKHTYNRIMASKNIDADTLAAIDSVWNDYDMGFLLEAEAYYQNLRILKANGYC